jgi:hypothetical protein
MTPEEINETLLYLLRSTRDQWQTLSDLAARVLAIFHYLELRDPDFENRVTRYENEAKSVVSPPTTQSLEWLDDTIRKLEGLRKRRQN